MFHGFWFRRARPKAERASYFCFVFFFHGFKFLFVSFVFEFVLFSCFLFNVDLIRCDLIGFELILIWFDWIFSDIVLGFLIPWIFFLFQTHTKKSARPWCELQLREKWGIRQRNRDPRPVFGIVSPRRCRIYSRESESRSETVSKSKQIVFHEKMKFQLVGAL